MTQPTESPTPETAPTVRQRLAAAGRAVGAAAGRVAHFVFLPLTLLFARLDRYGAKLSERERFIVQVILVPVMITAFAVAGYVAAFPGYTASTLIYPAAALVVLLLLAEVDLRRRTKTARA